jgi:hypothetical protein
MPATDAICAQIHPIHQAAEAADDVWRLSREAQATVKMGPVARGGQHRLPGPAAAHDFAPAATVTPVGFCLPLLGALLVEGVTSKVPSEGLGERLAEGWETGRECLRPPPAPGAQAGSGPRAAQSAPPMYAAARRLRAAVSSHRPAGVFSAVSTARTIRANVVGASSRTMGRGPCSTRLTRGAHWPGP